MFTGLVQAVGEVIGRENADTGARLTIRASLPAELAPGDSICVSGCCLTLAEPASQDPAEDQSKLTMAFDVIHETLSKTSIGDLGPGSRVNLETSCTPTTLLGGHIVQGHVEATGEVAGVQRGDDWRIQIAAPADLMPCITPKGSITIDGVSLTVAAVFVEDSSFEVALIPTTLEHTTLADLDKGSHCNLETDIMARTVLHYARHYANIDRKLD